MYFCWNVLPVFNLYSVYPAVSLCIYLHLANLQQIHGIPLYLTVSSCIRTYLAVSIQLYPAVSHSPYPTASKSGYDQKYTPGEG